MLGFTNGLPSVPWLAPVQYLPQCPQQSKDLPEQADQLYKDWLNFNTSTHLFCQYTQVDTSAH